VKSGTEHVTDVLVFYIWNIVCKSTNTNINSVRKVEVISDKFEVGIIGIDVISSSQK
jgi:hypothetical protein